MLDVTVGDEGSDIYAVTGGLPFKMQSAVPVSSTTVAVLLPKSFLYLLNQ